MILFWQVIIMEGLNLNNPATLKGQEYHKNNFFLDEIKMLITVT